MAEAEGFSPPKCAAAWAPLPVVRLTCDGMRPALLDVLNSYFDGLGENPAPGFLSWLDKDDETIVWCTRSSKTRTRRTSTGLERVSVVDAIDAAALGVTSGCAADGSLR